MKKCAYYKCENMFETNGAKKFCCSNCKTKQNYYLRNSNPEYRIKQALKRSIRRKHKLQTDPVYAEYVKQKNIKMYEQIKTRMKIDPEFRKLKCDVSKNYYKNNLDKCKEYAKFYYDNKRKSDEVYSLKHKLRLVLQNSVIKPKGENKRIRKVKYENIFGLSYKELRNWIESQFEPWMNWNNNGKYTGIPKQTWQLDHIIPLSQAQTIEDVYRLSYYTNLRPIDSKLNKELIKQ